MARPDTLRESVPGVRRMAVRFWPHIKRERGLIALSCLGLVGEVGFRLLEPWPLKFVFDRVIALGPNAGRSGVSVVDSMDPMTLLGGCALAVIGVVVLRSVASYSSTVGFALAGNRVLTRVRNELYRHVQNLSLSFHSRARSGDLLIRVIGDVGVLKEVLVTAILPMVANLLILIGMVVVMAMLNWRLAMVALAPLPVFWMAAVRQSRRIRAVARRQRKRQSKLATTAAESIEAIQVVQALSLEDTFAQAFTAASQQDLREGVEGKRLAAGLERTVDALLAVSTAIVLWFGARLVLTGVLTPGDLLVFMSYLRKALRPVRDFAKHTARFAKGTAAGERVVDLLDQAPEVCNLPGAVRAAGLRGDVRMEGVSYSYEPGRYVVRDVDFEVRAGTRIALIGPSGAGKSTLVRLLLRLCDPTVGRVLVDGRDMRDFTLESLRGQVSVVLQDGLLFAASVAENIACGTAEALTQEDIVVAARLAKADGFIRDLPQGYDTVLGEKGATLSRGQRQRIAIARAAVRKAPILILDEPTTGLDGESDRAVSEALERLARGRTSFLITHDLDKATTCDTIVYLERGRLVESGTHLELLRADGRYAALYHTQRAAHDGTARQGGAYAA